MFSFENMHWIFFCTAKGEALWELNFIAMDMLAEL